MRKLTVLIILSLIASSAFALEETANNGPQNVTWAWIKGAPPLERGSLLVLVTGNSATFPGKEVTGAYVAVGGTPSFGKIYGVYIGDTVSSYTTAMTNGCFIPVQTHGYVSCVLLDGNSAVQADGNRKLACRAGNVIVPSSTVYQGTVARAAYADSTTGNVMAFAQPVEGAGEVSAWINGI